MRGIVRPLVLAVAVAVTAVPVAAASAVDLSGQPPAIAWVPCPENPAVRCGTVSVPLD